MPLTSKITVQAIADLVTSLDLVNSSSPLSTTSTFDFTNGSGANQASLIFSDTRTLTASASENLDLAGVLTDAFGAVINFTKIKALILRTAAANTNDVVIGGAATNGFISPFGAATDTVKVRPGGVMVLVSPDATGYAVTAGTADQLKVANSGAGTPVTYDIVLIGA